MNNTCDNYCKYILQGIWDCLKKHKSLPFVNHNNVSICSSPKYILLSELTN